MSYQLTIEPLGQTVEIAEGQTVLDACLRAGVWLPHACGHGLCGTCKVQALQGELEHGEASPFALMDFEREESKCLACCATPLSDLTIEADIEPDPDAECLPLMDFTATVTRIETLTPTIRGVFLHVEGADALRFQPGQYVNVWIGREAAPRAFSIASAPASDEIELNVRLVPGGSATTYVHETLAIGERLQLSGPLGRFFVRKSDPRPLVFMAGGSGLSSPRSMVLDLLASGDPRQIVLVHGARTVDELYYRDAFEALAARHDNFTYVPVVSAEPLQSSWTGERGYVHEVASSHFGHDFRGWRAYLCGPPPMIESCIAALMQGRLFERDIFTEKFLSAADASQATRSPLFRSL